MDLFQVDTLTGSFSTGVNIYTPPGRKGIEPKINLSYNSSGPNSWLGVGWGLGFGSISRSTKDGVPSYDSSDTFVISFQGVSSELVEIATDEYRCKDEALFLKIEDAGTYWKVTDKSGTVYKFGQTSSSRQANGSDVFAWLFDYVEDTNGNYMEVSYTSDEGALYPYQITYTGNDDTSYSPLHLVEFTLEDRNDKTISYNTGYKILVQKRLETIEVKVNSQLARKYELDYEYSDITNRSLL